MKHFIIGLVAISFLGCEEKKAEPVAEPVEETVEKAAEVKKEEPAAANTEVAKTDKVMTATVGKPAPEFTLKDQDGKEHKLSDFKGKIVVLEWTCPTCPYVERHYEADTMQNTWSKFSDEKVQWLAIDSSHFVEAKKSAEWKKEEGFKYPVLQDKDGAVGRAYNAKTTPHMFVIDAEGVLQYDGAIDNDAHGDEEKVENYVHGAVQSLIDGKPIANPTNKPYGCSVKYNKS